MSLQNELTLRAKRSGYALYYKYSGFVAHSAFKNNNDMWIMINELDWNDSATTYTTLKDVQTALDEMENVI